MWHVNRNISRNPIIFHSFDPVYYAPQIGVLISIQNSYEEIIFHVSQWDNIGRTLPNLLPQ